jgi:hypothetical protein
MSCETPSRERLGCLKLDNRSYVGRSLMIIYNKLVWEKKWSGHHPFASFNCLFNIKFFFTSKHSGVLKINVAIQKVGET